MDCPKLNKVCFISGAPHSGSTLLGLILGSHSKSFYAGEANKTRFIGNDKINGPNEDKACKICGKNCPIWGDFKYDENVNLYKYLANKTKKSLIIDSTKNVKWLEKQIEALIALDSNIEQFLIYLGRDGRAIINSRIRKYKDTNVNQIIEEWKGHIEKTNRLYDSFEGKKIKIHYEELATNSVEVIKILCNFLDIQYEPNMLNYFQFEHHILGGNTGTQSLIVKSQNINGENSLIHLSERNEYYYKDHPLGIKLDLRWKEELDPKIQILFNKLAENLNKEFVWDGSN
ncbi:MAG: sulfotransferase [Candidatus Lokiarchaeota archaeon]